MPNNYRYETGISHMRTSPFGQPVSGWYYDSPPPVAQRMYNPYLHFSAPPPEPYGRPRFAPPAPAGLPYGAFSYPPPKAAKKTKTNPYRKLKGKSISVHVIQIPYGADPRAIFHVPNLRPAWRPFSASVDMLISDFFKGIGATKDHVVEEAVEEGDGCWSRGTKIIGGCVDPVRVSEVEWHRGHGLSTAADEPVWVIIRDKKKSE